MTETSERIIGGLIKDPNTSGQQTFPILQDSTLSIGRLRDNDIYLADPRVMRRHCRLYVEEGQVHLAYDYPSTLVTVNGTLVRESCRLTFGDDRSWGERLSLRASSEAARGGYRSEVWRSLTAACTRRPITRPLMHVAQGRG